MNHKLLLIISVLLFPATVLAESGDDVKNLITQLFTTDGYNKKVRPLLDQTVPVIIYVDFYLNAIIAFDEQEESLTTSGYLSIFWTDEYLDWTVSTYNGVEELFLPQDDIWRPDISLRNSYKSFTGLGSSYLNLRVGYPGIIQWTPFQVLKSTCSVDITYFPFDTQTCNLKFTAWSYTKNEVELNLGNNGIILEDYDQNSAWELISTSSYEVNTDEAAVVFVVTLKRKPLFYLMNVVAPVVMLTVLNAFTFVLPVSSGERASYSVTVFLSLAVFLTIIASELPKNSDTISFLGVYLMLMSSLSTIIVAMCLVQSRLAARNVDKHPVNAVYRWIYRVTHVLRCKGACKSLSCSNKKLKQVDPNSELCEPNSDKPQKATQDTEDVPEKQENITWMDVVNALDFLFFWFCIVFTFVCSTVLANVAIKN